MSHKDSSTDAAQRRIEKCLKASLDKNYRNFIISSDEEINGKRSVSSRKLAQILGPKDKRYNARLNKITQDILDVHGLTKSHFDIITRFEDELHASGGIIDNSIDANANKSNTTIVSLLSEMQAPYKKLIGYRYIYREMKELYGTKRAQELAGMLYDYSLAINDSTNILIPYCFAMDASSIITVGRQFGQLHSAPAKRLSSYISILNEVVHSFTNQIAGALAGLYLHDSLADAAHPLLPLHAGLAFPRNRHERAANGALHHLCHQLFHVLLHNERHPYSARHQRHSLGGAFHSNRLRHHQCLVENLDPFGGHRRFCRRSHRLFVQMVVQPRVVALPDSHRGRIGRHVADDSSTAHARAGGWRFWRRTGLCVCDDIEILKVKR